MRFADFTVLNGVILSRRAQDTEHLAPHAVAYCIQTLAELRVLPPHTRLQVCDEPDLFVEIGIPGGMDVNIDAHRFFSVSTSNDAGGDRTEELPFQYNLVLPDGPFDGNDYLSTGTLDALSRTLYRTTPDPDQSESFVEQLRGARPMMATTLFPVSMPSGDAVKVAADFSTCFAAAMLLSEPPADDGDVPLMEGV